MIRIIFVLSLLGGFAAGADWPQCLEDLAREEKMPEHSVQALLTSNRVGADEIFARLVFSESLASNCVGSEEEDLVVQGIAWVLRNRFNLPQRFGKGASVVTAPKQFRSTFGNYDVARRKEFLCPQKMGVGWELLWEKAKAGWVATQDSSANLLPGVYNYFLGNHFKNSKLNGKFPEPAWTKAPHVEVVPRLPGAKTTSNCIRFFR